MTISSILKPTHVKINCQAETTETILEEIIASLRDQAAISNEKTILNKLLEREKLGTTSIGNHAAVPHTKLKDISEPIIYIALSEEGIFYQESDRERVHLIILILSPSKSPILHLQILAAAASLIKKSAKLIPELLKAVSPEQLIQTINQFESNG